MGSPTILATFAVIAAVLLMAFVGDLMGPYMRPIPIGASAAMFFSLAIAFIVTPWASIRILRRGRKYSCLTEGAVFVPDGDKPQPHVAPEENSLTRSCLRLMRPLIACPRSRHIFLGGLVGLLLALARKVIDIFHSTPDVVDTGWYIEADQPKVRFAIAKEKAALHAISAETISETLKTAVGGESLDLLHIPREKEDVNIVLQLPLASMLLAPVRVPILYFMAHKRQLKR